MLELLSVSSWAGQIPSSGAGEQSTAASNGQWQEEEMVLGVIFQALFVHIKQEPPSLAMRETWVQFLGWEDPLEKGMTTHSSVLAWRIPGTGKPGGLPSLGSHRVGHD